MAKFQLILLLVWQSHSVSRQRFPKSRTVFRSDPVFRKYPSRHSGKAGHTIGVYILYFPTICFPSNLEYYQRFPNPALYFVKIPDPGSILPDPMFRLFSRLIMFVTLYNTHYWGHSGGFRGANLSARQERGRKREKLRL